MTVRLHRGFRAPTFNTARQTLSEAFGVDFAVGRDPHDCRADPAGNGRMPLTTGGESPESLLARAASDRQPIVEPLVDGRTLLVIPVVDDQGEDALACGVTDESGPLLLRLARTAMRSIRQQVHIDQYEEQLDDYACQVSRDFEELVWLRTFAEQIGGSRETQDTECIAAARFPDLRSMVQAEAIILVTYRYETSRACVPSVETKCRITRVGETAVSDHTVMQLIGDLGARALSAPVILNDFLARETLQQYPDLKSCVLVPIANQRYLYGWLLAVNRTIAAAEGHLSLEGLLL